MAVPVLWSISYSPWSDKARWALDHCEVEYRRKAYQPLLGEPALRMKIGRWTGTVSVPILDLGGEVLSDSFDIAKWADAHAVRDELRLFPEGREDDIRRYNDLSEKALSAGRNLELHQILADDEALFDLVPRNLRILGPVAKAIAAGGVRRTLRKYADVTPEALEPTIVEVLDQLRADLDAVEPNAEGQRFLLGTFSYADITMAESLAFVLPPKTHLRLTEATRRAFHRPELAARYEDLFAWRDGLYGRRKSEKKR